MLGAREHQHLEPLLVVDQVGEQGGLVALVHRHRPLAHALGGAVARAHVDLHRVVDQGLGEAANLVGEGGREHQGLTLLRQHLEDAADVMDEAHVQHPVRFVEHQDFQVVEAHRFLLIEIQQPAGGRHQDVHATAELVDLRVDLDPAEHHRRAHRRQVLAVQGDAFRHLGGQLAGGGEHQGAHLAGRRGGAFTEALQQRQGKAGGLAGAGLGGGHGVAAFQDGGYRLGLNRRRGGVTLLGNSTQQRIDQSEGSKIHMKSLSENKEGVARRAGKPNGLWGWVRVLFVRRALGWGAVGACLASERPALAGRRDTRDVVGADVRDVSGILPGAALPFAGRARSHKCL